LAEQFLRAAAAAGTTRLASMLTEILGLETAYGRPALLHALARAVQFRRFGAGQFHFSGIAVSPPCMKVDVEADSPGFGTWRETGIPVYPSIGVELYIQLDAQSHASAYAAGGAAAQLLTSCH